jgi:hypothetical protein
MKLKFPGDFKKLKKCVSKTGVRGKWRELENRQKQYRTDDGAILNWSKKSGAVWFQGQKPAIPNFKRAFVKAATKNGLLEGEREPVDEIADLNRQLQGALSEIAKLKGWRKRMQIEFAELREAEA